MKATIKTILDRTWKIGLGLFGLAVFIISILITVEWYGDKYGRYPWRDVELSPYVEVHCFSNSQYRVWNSQQSSYVTPKLRWVANSQCDSMTVYCDKDGYRGYLNCRSGEIVLSAAEFRYRHAWVFSEGDAVVVLPGEDSLSIIDYKGNIIAKNVAPYRYGYDYVFHDGICEFEKDGMTGLLALDGTWAIDPKYFEIEYPNTFGYRLARNEEGYWLFDSAFKKVFPEPFAKLEYAIGREEGTGTLYRSGKDHKKQLVNYDGSVVEPFVIDGTYDLKYKIRYNTDCEYEFVLSDLVVYCVDEWQGLMNKHSGRPITPANYTGFEMISKELIRAELSYRDCNSSVLMDLNGHIVNP